MTMATATVLPGRAAVDALRRSLAAGHVLLEVRATPAGPDWTPVTGEALFDWDAPLPLGGAKRFLFPPSETVLAWEGDAMTERRPAPRPFALFGLRACDVAAIGVLDRFFATDPWYVARRAAALLVGVNCLAACAGGFCLAVEAGPFARGGYDLALTPLPDGRVVCHVGSPAGGAAVARAGTGATALDGPTCAALAAAQSDAEATFASHPALARGIARVSGGAPAVGDAEWRALGPSCFACTGCTSLCPTCTCFTVVDAARDGGGERVRVWDSCLLEGFQRETSGHHPAPTPGDRVRRFVTHKVDAAFEPSLGRLGCVGCGRCDTTCPGGIGLGAVLARLGGG
jgi:formate hydrogenlyase subunit 6/NADH:ubiquinone oxidoreductase subunit I